jgi:hypothetical protein
MAGSALRVNYLIIGAITLGEAIPEGLEVGARGERSERSPGIVETNALKPWIAIATNTALIE